MENFLIPAILVAGLVGGVVLTRWLNWYAWGENRRKKEIMENRMKERAKTRKETDEGGV